MYRFTHIKMDFCLTSTQNLDEHEKMKEVIKNALYKALHEIEQETRLSPGLLTLEFRDS